MAGGEFVMLSEGGEEAGVGEVGFDWAASVGSIRRKRER